MSSDAPRARGCSCDAGASESVAEQAWMQERLQRFFDRRWTIGELVELHTTHKLLLMAHSPDAYARIGRLVAEASEVPRAELRDRYCRDVITALAVPATPGRHANVLQHMAGYFSDMLDDGDRGELSDLIEDHRLGRVPLAAPLALVRHHVRRQRVEWLQEQVYLYGPSRSARPVDA